MSKENPIAKEEKIAKRIEPDIETDSFKGIEEKEIIDLVLTDAEIGIKVRADWLEEKKKNIQHYEGEKPSILESLKKEEWQSDRNLGMCAATCDIYQATLLSTCWNPDTLHFIATEITDVDNKTNVERFAKWVVSPAESNLFPEIDDFIHNRVTLGFSLFKGYWKVWYEWVDKRIPKDNGGYTIKTEKMRFEKGVLEDISNIDDILIPEYGKNVQGLPFFIHVIHLYTSDIRDMGKRKIFKNVDEQFIDKIKNACLEKLKQGIEKEKADKLGISDVTEAQVDRYPIDLYEWYGEYTVGNKTEKYRFMVEPYTKTLLSVKPLRKVNRLGKIPFFGGALIRRPGFIKGTALPTLIAPVVNAINNVFNQMSDYQYVTNCPFGFYIPDEGYTQQEYKLSPMDMYPVSGPDASKSVFFPNLSRSMAWSYQHIQMLFEVLEKLTGAASYFMTTKSNVDGTATRDKIVNEKSEIKFGLWVSRIQADICEGINFLIALYQDNAPPNLGKRVLGKDGKQLIRNLSVKSLRGNYDCSMQPDYTAGSKAIERQTQMWLYENMQQNIWFNPQINPKGSWNLAADTIKSMNKTDVERYMPPEPSVQLGKSDELEQEWTRFAQGEDFDPPLGENPLEHFIGHMAQKAEKYFELDEEYRPNFDKHFLKTTVNFQNFLKQQQQEKMANMMALDMIRKKNSGIQEPQL